MAAMLQSCFAGIAATTRSTPAPMVPDLVLTRTLSIPPGTAHVTFQDGATVVSADRYRPYCEFEINTVAEQPQAVPAGLFRVGRTAYRTLQDELAGIPALPGFNLNCGDDVYYETRWQLRAEHYREARVLICREVFDACRPGRYPGPVEIQQALGSWFELQPLAGEPAP